MPNPTPEQAKIDAAYSAAYGDPNHPIHSHEPGVAQAAAEELLAQTQRILGDSARGILAQFGGENPPRDYTSQPVGSEAAPNEPPITDRATALALAESVGFDKGEMTKLMDVEGRYAPGQFTLEQALHGYDPTERARLKTLHKIGMDRLPLSLQLHLERRGTAWAPGVFSRIAELGQDLEALDAAIRAEAEQRPGSPRLRELVMRRHGRQHVTIF